MIVQSCLEDLPAEHVPTYVEHIMSHRPIYKLGPHTIHTAANRGAHALKHIGTLQNDNIIKKKIVNNTNIKRSQ